MSEFVTRIKVRYSELDPLGHVNHAAYHQYGEIARTEWFNSVAGDAFMTGRSSIAPVLLETRVRFRRELLANEEIDVSCNASFGERKTFTMESEVRKADGTLSAEIECVLGIMDLERRKLVDNPLDALRSIGARV